MKDWPSERPPVAAERVPRLRLMREGRSAVASLRAGRTWTGLRSEGRSHVLDAILGHQRVEAARRCSITFGQMCGIGRHARVGEHLLNTAGCEDCEHPRGLVALYPERVRNTARQVRKRAWADGEVDVAADDPQGALDDLQELILAVMDVQWWPEPRGHPELGCAYPSVIGGADRELHRNACAHLQDVFACA